MKWFKVYLRGKLIDEMPYSDSARVTAADVRRSLIDHDGYDSGIRVTQYRGRKRAKKNPRRYRRNTTRRLPKNYVRVYKPKLGHFATEDRNPDRTARMSRKKLAAYRAKHWRFNPRRKRRYGKRRR